MQDLAVNEVYSLPVP